ncbi:hypothetical protein SFRURICE_018457 [Spodoptera frugiperda]|nr:hypothetical protein SFRURICE_018457 [Spodoptera frugiperda]
MEPGFVKADSNNLPRIDAIMLGRFFASNNDFCSSEFRNIKTSMSSRASYGDDAVSYVQLKRENKFCTVKCKYVQNTKFMPNYMDVHWWLMKKMTLFCLVQCQDCVASQVGTTIKYMTAKELSKGNPILPANPSVFNNFLEEARKKKVEDCQL